MPLLRRNLSKDLTVSDEMFAHSATNMPARPRLVFSRSRIPVIASLIIAAFIFVLCKTKRGVDPLPDLYALCNPDRKIYTIDPSRPITDCILVHGKYIHATGTLEEIREHWRTDTAYTPTIPRDPNNIPIYYTRPGSIVIPGMSDSHGHVLELGMKIQLDLDGVHSVEQAVRKVREYILARPNLINDVDVWIEGGGWDHTNWADSKWPTLDDLETDPIIRGRPVVLLSKDGHALWCSLKAIQLSSPLPSSVEGGVIFRDSAGNPTGTLLDRATDLIVRPPWSESRMLEYFTDATNALLSRGLTAVHDAGLTPLAMKIFQRLAHENKLPIRVYAMRYFNESESYWGAGMSKIIGHADNRFTVRSVKIFTDGALRTGGAALHKPYSDTPETRGFFRTNPVLLQQIIPRFIRDGWQVNTHCIGDRANGMFLDLMERLSQDVNIKSSRPRLEHAQTIAPEDYSRLGRLGVISSVQPSHAIDDMWFAEERLGPERVKGTYAFRSILNHSAPMTLGSDFPVADFNPLATFYAAITRLSINGKSPHGSSGWFPEQRLTRQEALKGLTLDPAFASFAESIHGSLVAGKRADYVVLSKDILTIPASEILQTEVIATVLDGKVAYGNL